MTRSTGGGLTYKLLPLTLYREGKQMVHVDFFSRNPVGLDHRKIDKIAEKEINLAEMSKDWLLAEQRRDPQIVEITRKLQNYELAEDIANTYELQPGTLYRRIQRKGKTLCLPTSVYQRLSVYQPCAPVNYALRLG